ncbi:phosphoribosyltransferase [Phytohabitans flavus]|uniref:phosphoribosyltransferase n=1 Tax=Phytohabitans flavus TaxID=1076124 RepID=UPI0031ED9412
MLISWEQACLLADDLATQVTKGDCQLNFIVAIARGGFVPARLLSARLDVARLASIGIRYIDDSRTRREFYSFPHPVGNDHRILLVEDVLETGQSLLDARDRLVEAGARVWTAAYFYQSRSAVPPDFSLGVRDEPVMFPWD